MAEKIPSPKGGKRGCLCKDGTYSKKCCDGSLEAQGIGKTAGTGTKVKTTELER